mmetsp:Transcript_16839/g.23766  ORF Transcript_16839/g.23766 Transcript_16839/m.23766 type:complete len:207 (-) Transcript_16839:389-1009(-)
MRVSMKETILHNLPQRTLHKRIHKLLPIQIIRFQTSTIRKSKPIHPLHRQHLPTGKFRIYLGNKHIGNRDILSIQFRKSTRIGSFSNVIDFGIKQVAKVIHDTLQIDIPSKQLKDFIIHSSPPSQHEQIQCNHLLRIGTLDLQRHQLSILQQSCLVHLTNGSSSDRLRFDQFKHLLKLDIQFLLDYLKCHLISKCGDIILQLLQFI